jgi:methionyl-tRNA formyltransferase
LKIIFAGTPEFAAAALQALIAAGHDVGLVLTQPDKPAGRGMKLNASAVKQVAQSAGIAVAQPRSLRLDGKYKDDAAAAHAALIAARADVMVVAAYGLILPQSVLDIPRHGCVNIHASLLPRWRGAAPIHRAIEAGDSETGVTLMQMDAGLDTGAMLSVERMPITPAHTTGRLHDALAAMGARMIARDLPAIVSGALPPVAQPDQGVTYAEKIRKEEARIDWSQSAEVLARRIRAFDPFPGAVTRLNDEDVKLWHAQAVPLTGAPGEILALGRQGLIVAAGQGAIEIGQVQRPGGKRLSAAEFMQSIHREALVGQRFS